MSPFVYVDTSVVLAAVRAEAAAVPAEYWAQPLLVASALTEFERWFRLHALGEAAERGPLAEAILANVALVGLPREIGARCRAPFPRPLRTLDALHLATADHLRARGFLVRVATLDARLAEAALAMGFAVGL